MSSYFRTLLAFTLIVVSTPSFGQQSWANCLLWRISGKGLNKPSYLYGTLHLQDKRLFNFGDSLYHGLENVDGFALEVDFKEYMDSLFRKGVKEAEKLERQRIKVDNKKLDKSVDSIFKKLNINKENLTKKDLKKIRDYRTAKLLQEGEMPTIVDGYLFGLALRQGKLISGIEDVSDQLYLLDELGGELTPEKVLQPETAMRKGLEQMVQLYLHQDLNGINDAINGYDANYRDALLIRRNGKMARRMDSLLALRTMFFAVGAAHLPGDSGVISLLRSRGFTVEPVYSSQKLPASDYAQKLQAIPWYQVQDESQLYTIEMPGNPSQFNEYGEVFKMKMFFDLTTMTFYLSGQTIGNLGSNKDFENAFKEMAARMGVPSEKLKPKNVARNGMEAMEANIENEGFTFRVQLVQKNNNLFILMAGGSKKEALTSADVNRFFSSFNAHNIETTNKEWTKFNLPEKAFLVKLPGQPKRNELIDRKAEGTNWKFATYDYVDNAKGLYYMLQVRELNAGYYLESDSAYFEQYIEQLKAGMDSILKKEIGSYNGFPALYLDALYNKNVLFKTMLVTRGSRIYSLMVGGQSITTIPDAETYFNSLTFSSYLPTEWKTYESGGFTTSAPSAVKKQVMDSTQENANARQQLFVAYDPNTAVSYEVIKQKFPDFYWARNDSSFFEEKSNLYIGEGDSILKKAFALNGQLKSLDLLIRKSQTNNLEKVRLMVNGDTLYTLVAFIPSQIINEGNHQKFFEEFKIETEVQPTIYSSKAEALMTALQTGDSSQFQQALESFKVVEFTKTDLPVLHKALLGTYKDSLRSFDVQKKIIDRLKELADSSTLHFVQTSFARLPETKEDIKYTLLEVVANIRTEESYGVLKQLLLTSLPMKGDATMLKYALSDSLGLTRTLYPEILKLSHDSVFSDVLVELTDQLLDSNLIAWAEVLPYRDVFLKQAKRNCQHLQKDPDNWWLYNSWVSFLGRFNDKESNNLLQAFLGLPVSGIKLDAIKALLKNGQPVPAAELGKLASDKDFRVNLYYQLKALNKQHLFPATYAWQQSLSESEVYQIASEEYEVGSVLYIGERIRSFQGKKKKFHLYKITLNLEEGKESYLGITGPYELTTKELIPFSDASGIYWDEKFDRLKTDKQFDAFVNQQSQ